MHRQRGNTPKLILQNRSSGHHANPGQSIMQIFGQFPNFIAIIELAVLLPPRHILLKHMLHFHESADGFGIYFLISARQFNSRINLMALSKTTLSSNSFPPAIVIPSQVLLTGRERSVKNHPIACFLGEALESHCTASFLSEKFSWR